MGSSEEEPVGEEELPRWEVRGCSLSLCTLTGRPRIIQLGEPPGPPQGFSTIAYGDSEETAAALQGLAVTMGREGAWKPGLSIS